MVSRSLSPAHSATVTSSNLNVHYVQLCGVTSLVMGCTVCCTNKGWNLVSHFHVVLGVHADQLPIYTLIQMMI